VTFDGISLDEGGALTKPPALSRRIEIVGDSLSVGFHIYSNHGYDVPTDQDATNSYSWLLGEKIDAEIRLIAITGHGLIHDYGTAPADSRPMPQYYAYLHREYTIPNDWSWQPDTIIVNLGTNDITPPDPTPSDVFQSAYVNFLTVLRRDNPQALIIAMQPFGVQYKHVAVFPQEIRAAVKIRQRSGDSRVFYVNTAGWLSAYDFTDGAHPNLQGTRKAAAKLAAALEQFGPITISP
jgi:lysophospholipase L1-like esterase